MSGKKSDRVFSNHLLSEKSPYLLQHAHNPVDWYPWGDEAFERARALDKPIFLSIGYSTCHWCHVMAHESFEDPDVGRLMNDAFISIKVDREERPDIDGLYMSVCQLMTGGGGWPLTIIMTPEKRPFFAATYLPKNSRHGRIGMLDLIPRVRDLWHKERYKADRAAEHLQKEIKKLAPVSSGEAPGKEIVNLCFQQLAEIFDEKNGGFGRAPKFPTPHHFLFLLRYWRKNRQARALEIVEKTLERMRLGGIYDHIGFGFHRYSTDEHWLLPHFEKMLYDQSLIIMAYSEAYQSTKNRIYAETAEEIICYVLRDMLSPEGGFYSAEDADSEGVEGKFYLWGIEEIRKTLPGKDADLFIATYGIEEEGNFYEEATGKKSGKNILYLKSGLTEISEGIGIPLEELKKRLISSKRKLFHEREKRVHPLKDDKILTDWNGLMIAALATASRALGKIDYGKRAKNAADFILSRMSNKEGRLFHRYKDGEAAISGFLDDYAFISWGLIELYETVFEEKYLKSAITITENMIEHFGDNGSGGFYFTPDDGEDLLYRRKEIYDGAMPSGNSVAMSNLLRLFLLTGNERFREFAVETGKAFSKTLSLHPSTYSHMISAVDFMLGPTFEVVISGIRGKKDTAEMIKALQKEFLPNKVALFRPGDKDAPEITSLAEFTKPKAMLDGRATAYVCSDYSCKSPTTDTEAMLKLLKTD